MGAGLEAFVLLECFGPVPALGGPFADLDVVLCAGADGDIIVGGLGDREVELVEFGFDFGDLGFEGGDLFFDLGGGGFDLVDLGLDGGFVGFRSSFELAHELTNFRAGLFGELLLFCAEGFLLAHQRASLLVEFEERFDVHRVVFSGGAGDKSLWVFAECFEVNHGERV